MANAETETHDDEQAPGVTGVLQKVARHGIDLAKDQLALAGAELLQGVREAVVRAALAILAGMVAAVGLGMLCVSVVVALEPAIPSLAARLVLMAVVYLVIGGAATAGVAWRLGRRAKQGLKRTKEEAQETVDAIKEM
jgi:uncharacterized membrane protein YqjE